MLTDDPVLKAWVEGKAPEHGLLCQFYLQIDPNNGCTCWQEELDEKEAIQRIMAGTAREMLEMLEQFTVKERARIIAGFIEQLRK